MPFGWEDCAEGDEGAQPLYEQAQVDTLVKQRDKLLAACEVVIAWDKARTHPLPYKVRDPIFKAVSSVKGGAA